MYLGSITGIELPASLYTFDEEMAKLSIIAVTLANCSVILFYDVMIGACSGKAISLDITRPTHRLPAVARNPESLMRAASGIIDTRRLKHLTAEHQAQVNCHPEVKLLCQTKTKLKQFIRETYGSVVNMKEMAIHDRYKKAWENYCKNRRRQEKAFFKDVKARFKKEQPVIDNKRQLKQLPPIEADVVFKTDCVFTEPSCVIEALFTLAASSIKEECERRVEVIVRQGHGHRYQGHFPCPSS